MMSREWRTTVGLSDWDLADTRRLIAVMDRCEYRRTAVIADAAGMSRSRAMLLLPAFTGVLDWRLVDSGRRNGTRVYEWRLRADPTPRTIDERRLLAG
jgi:hypothetical protein